MKAMIAKNMKVKTAKDFALIVIPPLFPKRFKNQRKTAPYPATERRPPHPCDSSRDVYLLGPREGCLLGFREGQSRWRMEIYPSVFASCSGPGSYGYRLGFKESMRHVEGAWLVKLPLEMSPARKIGHKVMLVQTPGECNQKLMNVMPIVEARGSGVRSGRLA